MFAEWCAKFKAAVKKLKREVLALYYASLDPTVGLLPKIIIAVALGYVLSPIDLIPDFIPVLGLLDDLLIVPILIWLALRLIPPAAMTTARHRADTEPLKLSKHLCAATVFLLIWLACFEGGAAVLVDQWSMAHAHKLPTYGIAFALFVAFTFFALLSESEEARVALKRYCTCGKPAYLEEPLLPSP